MESTFIDLLIDALKSIGSDYFNVVTTYDSNGIVRERVFCYELYHQLRTLLKDEKSIVLHAEIDKRGHIDFGPYERRNPDFIFHTPGTHKGNTIVIEVKGKFYNDGLIKNDFDTLLTFVERYQYKVGVFIIYNCSLVEFLSRYNTMLSSLKTNSGAPCIYIITIKSPGEEPEVKKLAEVS